MKLLIMRFSSPLCDILILGPNILLSFLFLPQCGKPLSTH